MKNIDVNNLQLIQENMYNLYKMTSTQLDPLLGRTYHRKESGEDWLNKEYCCVIKVTEQDALRLYNKQYNELSLNLILEPDDFKCLSLAVYTIDDGSWTAYIPYIGQDLFLLWSSILEKIRPTVDQLFDNNHQNYWFSFTHDYFLGISKELGATEYDYD